MAIGFRIFFLDENNALQRIPLKKFECVYLRSDCKERFPEYAGQRIRYALVMVQTESRKPVAIKRIDCSVIRFNAKGKLDKDEWLRGARLAMDTVSFTTNSSSSGSLIDATSSFSKRRYEHEFRWQLSPEIEKAVEDAIFGSKLTP